MPPVGSVSGPAAGRLCLAGVHERLQERAGRQDDRPGRDRSPRLARARRQCPRLARRASRPAASSTISCRSDEVRLLLDEALDLELVGLLVGLGPGAVHGRALAAVEQAELDAGGVGDQAHRPAQGVDLADDLPLGDAADGRVAAHLADRVQAGREQGRLGAQSGGGQGRLGAGMAGADDDDIEIVLGKRHATDDSCWSIPQGGGARLWNSATQATSGSGFRFRAVARYADFSPNVSRAQARNERIQAVSSVPSNCRRNRFSSATRRKGRFQLNSWA